MTRLRKEGETCDVTLADGTPAILCSGGRNKDFIFNFLLDCLRASREFIPMQRVAIPF